MTLRQDALWVKQNWVRDSRKHWVLNMLALHMGFRWLDYGVERVEEYDRLLYAIRQMKPAHRLVLRDILCMRSYGVVVRFPDGMLWEVRCYTVATFIRPLDSDEWQDKPSLVGIWDILYWIETADLELWQPGEWKGKDG